MKKILFFISALCLVGSVHAQEVATLEVKEPIPGTCDTRNIYALCSAWKGQIEPISPVSKSELQAKLTNEVQYIKDNPKYKGTIFVHLIINCKGEMLKCEIGNKSGIDELDNQVLVIFKPLLKWTPGKLNGSNVDCSVSYMIEFKKGKIKLDE